MRSYYQKYVNLFKDLTKKLERTNNVDNIIKYNQDHQEMKLKFESIAFNFKDAFIQNTLEKIKNKNIKIYSQLEIINEYQKIKLDLVERIHMDLPKKFFGSFFINRFYNKIILSNFKEMSSLLFLWFDPNIEKIEKSLPGYRQELRALRRLDYLIKNNDFEGAYEILKYLNNYKDLTQNFEKKLSNHIKSHLLFDLIQEHAKI